MQKKSGPVVERWYIFALSIGVVTTLGVLRAIVLVVQRHAFSHPVPIIRTMMLLSAVWLPVPAIFEWIRRRPAGFTTSLRWIAAVALIAVAVPAYSAWVLPRMGGPRTGGWLITALLGLDSNLMICGAIAAMLALRAAHQRRMAMAAASARLAASARQAEIGLLTMQLQPHFLFNTLNLISQLAFENLDKARRSLRNLRQLLITSVEHGSRGAVSLREELEFLEAYLDVQRLRFGDRLDARIIDAPDTMDAAVPPMLLQPIVENALRHGFGQRASGGRISILVRRAADTISIVIDDNGVGFATFPPREGMGLANARHRLAQFFGVDRARMTYSSRRTGGASVQLEFPVASLPESAASDKVQSDIPMAVADSRWLRMPESSIARAGMLLAGWAFVAAVWIELFSMVPAVPGNPPSLAMNVGWNGINAAVWVLLTPCAIWLTDRLFSQPAWRRIAGHIVGAFVVTSVHLFVTGALMSLLLHSPASDVQAVRAGWAVWDAVAYLVLAVVAESLNLRAQARTRATELARASDHLESMRFSLLRLQLQPEILIGGLDAVERAMSDPEVCEPVISRLGDVLRRLLAVAGRADDTIENEIALASAYMAMMQGSLTALRDEDVSTATRIPAVFLLPLTASLGASDASLTLSRSAGMLQMDLVSIRRDATDVNAERLGILERRFAAVYGERGSFQLTCRDGNAGVHVEIPAAWQERTEGTATLARVTAVA